MSEAKESAEGQTSPRRHHYVPAFLLQGFTPSGRRDDFLWVLDLEQQKSWKARPDQTAHERDYYRVDLVDVDPYLVESTFAEIETHAATLISTMLRTCSLPTGQELEHLIQFVTLLALRSPSMRDLYEQNMKHVRKHALKVGISNRAVFDRFVEDYRRSGKELPAGLTYESLRDFVWDDDAYNLVIPRTESVKMILEQLQNLVPVFLARRWSLLLAAPSEGDFVCSDMPVSITPTTPDFKPQFLGFGLRETELTVPLSRSMVLVGSYEAPSITEQIATSGIRLVNQRTANFTTRFIYSPVERFLA